jgi:hypothetical protein
MGVPAQESGGQKTSAVGLSRRLSAAAEGGGVGPRREQTPRIDGVYFKQTRRVEPTAQRRSKKLNDTISELIGAIANTEVANGGTKINLKALARILTEMDIDSDLWDHYKARTDGLIRKAYDYFVNKGDAQTADNIKKTFIKSNGQHVIS